MRVLYVADNRNRSNWGCRGTSIALSQLLSSRFHIQSVISGREVDPISCDPTYIGSRLPTGVYRKLSGRSGYPIIRAYLAVEARLGARQDYVTSDPVESAENLLRYRGSYPHLERIHRQVQECEAVVINGEGTMIFQPERRKAVFLLMIIELAHRLGKTVFYVNANVSDCPVTGRNETMAGHARSAFRKCAAVAVRDPISLRTVVDLDPGIEARFVPDALFSWYPRYGETARDRIPAGDHLITMPERDGMFGKLDFSRPYVCLSGSSRLETAHFPAAIESYARLAESLGKLGRNVVLVQTCPGGDRFLNAVSERTGLPLVPVNVPIVAGGAILANAEALVSGRYHPSIFASLGGTPCVFMGSNSHKTMALQHILEYPNPSEYPVVPDPPAAEAIVAEVEAKLRQGEALRRTILDVAARRCREAHQVLDIIGARVDSKVVMQPA